MRCNTIARLWLLGTACLWVLSCAHAPEETRETSRIYLYEVEFRFDGKPLQALRHARCFSEVICPKRPYKSPAPSRPRAKVPVSPFPQGHEVAYFGLTPKRAASGGELVVRVRLSDSKESLNRYLAKCSKVPCRLADTGGLRKNAVGVMAQVPVFPVEVAVHFGAPTAESSGSNYFYMMRDLRHLKLSDKKFTMESLGQRREFYEQPLASGVDVRELEPGEWVEFRHEYSPGAGPLFIQILGMDMELNVDSF